MPGGQTYRSPESAPEEEIDSDMPVVESEVPAEDTEAVLDDIDALLDEIEGQNLLETNPQEFVDGYVQQNGE
jgi:ubiquitin-like protein Pup